MQDNSYGIVIGIVWMIERLTAIVSESQIQVVGFNNQNHIHIMLHKNEESILSDARFWFVLVTSIALIGFLISSYPG